MGDNPFEKLAGWGGKSSVLMQKAQAVGIGQKRLMDALNHSASRDQFLHAMRQPPAMTFEALGEVFGLSRQAIALIAPGRPELAEPDSAPLQAVYAEIIKRASRDPRVWTERGKLSREFYEEVLARRGWNRDDMAKAIRALDLRRVSIIMLGVARVPRSKWKTWVKSKIGEERAHGDIKNLWREVNEMCAKAGAIDVSMTAFNRWVHSLGLYPKQKRTIKRKRRKPAVPAKEV